jgi:microcystin-dependent protein
MSEPFLAEVRMVGFNFAPRGWAFCDGQILPINQNQSLYSLLGTTYGGDGRTSFALPDLRGRTPIHVAQGHSLGQKSGEETHTLSVNEMAAHSHNMQANSTTGGVEEPATNTLLGKPNSNLYAAGNSTKVQMSPTGLNSAGGGQAHDNMQPFLAINFCIALQGLFPSRN